MKQGIYLLVLGGLLLLLGCTSTGLLSETRKSELKADILSEISLGTDRAIVEEKIASSFQFRKFKHLYDKADENGYQHSIYSIDKRTGLATLVAGAYTIVYSDFMYSNDGKLKDIIITEEIVSM